MIENWVKATTTSTATPYSLTAVSGFPDFSDAYSQTFPVSFMLSWGDNRESGIGHIDGSGNLVVEDLLTTWDGTTYTKAENEGGVTPLSKSGTIDVTVFPDGSSIAKSFSALGIYNVATNNLNIAYSADLGTTWSSQANIIGFATNRLVFHSFLLLGTHRTNSFHVDYGTSAATQFRIGLYSQRRGMPWRKIAESAQIDASLQSGVTSHTFAGGAVTLPPGWYFLAKTANDEVSIRASGGDAVGNWGVASQIGYVNSTGTSSGTMRPISQRSGVDSGSALPDEVMPTDSEAGNPPVRYPMIGLEYSV